MRKILLLLVLGCNGTAEPTERTLASAVPEGGCYLMPEELRTPSSADCYLVTATASTVLVECGAEELYPRNMRTTNGRVSSFELGPDGCYRWHACAIGALPPVVTVCP